MFLFGLVTISQTIAQSDTNKWVPLEFLIGRWEGNGTGRFGDSDISREYEYLMGTSYIIGKNQSIYEKQEQNSQGEIHDNWDIFSYDKHRKKYLLRQFHAEDITNTYGLDSVNAVKGVYEFESETIENFGEGWRAKEVYQIIDKSQFIEIFYLAAPGKEYSEYVRNKLTRVK